MQDTEEVIENSSVDPQLKEQQESTTKMLLSERDLVDEIDELLLTPRKLSLKIINQVKLTKSLRIRGDPTGTNTK